MMLPVVVVVDVVIDEQEDMVKVLVNGLVEGSSLLDRGCNRCNCCEQESDDAGLMEQLPEGSFAVLISSPSAAQAEASRSSTEGSLQRDIEVATVATFGSASKLSIELQLKLDNRSELQVTAAADVAQDDTVDDAETAESTVEDQQLVFSDGNNDELTQWSSLSLCVFDFLLSSSAESRMNGVNRPEDAPSRSR